VVLRQKRRTKNEERRGKPCWQIMLANHVGQTMLAAMGHRRCNSGYALLVFCPILKP
jgi:hypothetical protein